MDEDAQRKIGNLREALDELGYETKLMVRSSDLGWRIEEIMESLLHGACSSLVVLDHKEFDTTGQALEGFYDIYTKGYPY